MLEFEKYRTATAVTSDKSYQLIFIFDEIIKLLHSTRKAIDNGDHELKFKAISRIIDVFIILKSGINLESGDIDNKNINSFYEATIAQLEQINIDNSSVNNIKTIMEALSEVREAINESIKNDSCNHHIDSKITETIKA